MKVVLKKAVGIVRNEKNSRYSLKVEWTRFLDKLDVRYERKEELKMSSRFLD